MFNKWRKNTEKIIANLNTMVGMLKTKSENLTNRIEGLEDKFDNFKRNQRDQEIIEKHKYRGAYKVMEENNLPCCARCDYLLHSEYCHLLDLTVSDYGVCNQYEKKGLE